MKLEHAQRQRLEEVVKRFSNERRAWDLLTSHGSKGKTSSTLEAPHLISNRLFDVNLSMTTVASRQATANSSVRHLLEVSYPIVQDHGPSIDWVRDAVREFYIHKGRCSTRTLGKHPDLSDIVNELTNLNGEIDEESGSRAKKIVDELETQAVSMMDEIHRLGLLHGSVGSRNICMQLRSKCKGAGKSEDSPFVIRWIDFARSQTRLEHGIGRGARCDIDWKKEADVQRDQVRSIFRSLRRALEQRL